MPSTWSQVLLHIVFSTKSRTPWIGAEGADDLYGFIGGIVRDEGGTLLAIGGMPDHIHMLVRWGTEESISVLVRHVKTRSSRWMHESRGVKPFAWQVGYGVFSVSQSQAGVVKAYIKSQAEHHAKWSFREELVALLKAHGVEFEEQYVDCGLRVQRAPAGARRRRKRGV
ncbi:MAG: IS200/IS605 family transposase [Phycisphaeraceae bacterium]|nr:MAG: IS200/IS605 family transposase [Phycisphaeraceae bacterium]